MGLDPGEERRRTDARALMLRVALVLLDDARRAGGFETDEGKLEARSAELAAEFGADLPADDADGRQPVEACPESAEQIHLTVHIDDLTSFFASLRSDGVLHGGGTTFGVSLEPTDEAGLTPADLERMARVQAEVATRAIFRGDRFIRAVAAPSQPDAEVRILAAELFADGLIVHLTYDREEGPTQSEFPDPHDLPWDEEPALTVEDDVGTEYVRNLGGEGGGVQVAHDSIRFSPTVPAEASLLRVTSRSGTVELPL